MPKIEVRRVADQVIRPLRFLPRRTGPDSGGWDLLVRNGSGGRLTLKLRGCMSLILAARLLVLRHRCPGLFPDHLLPLPLSDDHVRWLRAAAAIGTHQCVDARREVRFHAVLGSAAIWVDDSHLHVESVARVAINARAGIDRVCESMVQGANAVVLDFICRQPEAGCEQLSRVGAQPLLSFCCGVADSQGSVR